MDRIVGRIAWVSRLLARAAGALILFSAVLVSLDVLFRNVFKMTLFESFELTSYAVAMAITFGFAWALVTKAHIRIEVIYNLMPLAWRSWLDVISLGVLAVVAVVATWWGAQVALESFAMQSRSNSTLAVPMAIPQGLWALGLAWFAACSVVLFGVAAYGVLRRRYVAVRRIFGVASVEEEIDHSVESGRDGDAMSAGRT